MTILVLFHQQLNQPWVQVVPESDSTSDTRYIVNTFFWKKKLWTHTKNEPCNVFMLNLSIIYLWLGSGCAYENFNFQLNLVEKGNENYRISSTD